MNVVNLGALQFAAILLISTSRGEESQTNWEGKTYRIFYGSENGNFDAAQEKCRSINAELTSLLSMEEHNMLITIARNLMLDNIWIGLTIDDDKPCDNCSTNPGSSQCTECRRRWRWLDGSSMSDLSDEFLNQAWRFNEPTGGHACARLSKPVTIEYFWMDPPNCGEIYSIACKGDLSSELTSTPTRTTTTTSPTTTITTTATSTASSTRTTPASRRSSSVSTTVPSTVYSSKTPSNKTADKNTSTKKNPVNESLMIALIVGCVLAFIAVTVAVILVTYMLRTEAAERRSKAEQPRISTHLGTYDKTNPSTEFTNIDAYDDEGAVSNNVETGPEYAVVSKARKSKTALLPIDGNNRIMKASQDSGEISN